MTPDLIRKFFRKARDYDSSMREATTKDLRLGKKSRKQSKSTNHMGGYFKKQLLSFLSCRFCGLMF